MVPKVVRLLFYSSVTFVDIMEGIIKTNQGRLGKIYENMVTNLEGKK